MTSKKEPGSLADPLTEAVAAVGSFAAMASACCFPVAAVAVEVASVSYQASEAVVAVAAAAAAEAVGMR